MSDLPAKRRYLAAGIGTVIAVSLVLAGLALYFGSYGDCKSSVDCGAGRECMEWNYPREGRHWWARGLTYRTCEIPCEMDADCPHGYECGWTDHGPGPGKRCVQTGGVK